MDGTRLPERKTGTHSTLVRKRGDLRGDCLNVVNRSPTETIQMPWAAKNKTKQKQNSGRKYSDRLNFQHHFESLALLLHAGTCGCERLEVLSEIQANSRSLGKWFVSREKSERAHSLFLVLIEIVIDITWTHEALLTFLPLDKHFHSQSLVKTFSITVKNGG